ncbi:MAG: hypothetical protein ACFCUI_07195 [Bernardetiaceae bacterium]
MRLKTLSFLSLMLLLVSMAHGQTTAELKALPVAKLTPELYVQIVDLPDTPPTAYVADISPLRLADQAAAERFFAHFDDKTRVVFTVFFAQQLVKIDLQSPEGQPWTAQQWAMYFKNKIVAQRQAIGEVDFREQ